VATVGAAALFATTGTARIVSDVKADSVTIAAVRLVIGSLGLVVVSVLAGRGRNLLLLWRQPVVWVMGAGVASYQALFFIGTGRVGVAIGTLASLALAPLMAGMLTWALGRSRPTNIWWLSTVIAIAGLAALTLSGLNSDVAIDVLGIFAAVGAGSAYAVYTVVGSDLSHSEAHATDVLAASFVIGAALLLPLGWSGLGQLQTAHGIELSLWLGLVATTFAYVLFGVGITRLTASTVATLNLAEPVVATLLGVFVVGEVVQGLAAVGCLLIASALLVLAISTMKESS